MVVNLKSTKMELNPMIPPPNKRPKCRYCNLPCAIISCLKDGSPNYRKVCHQHHAKKIIKRHGVSSMIEIAAQRNGVTVAEYTQQRLEKRAEKNGVSVTALRRSYHKYRKFMKDYCENRDGSVLPFTCTTTVFPDMGMLEVDHISGDPSDNRPVNFQTLCKCCHAFKTFANKDYATPGRKALGVK